MKRAIVLALATLSLASTPASTRAWAGLTPSNPRWSGTVPYGLHEAGSSDLGGYEATLAIVRDGMDDWTRESCSGLRTNFTGPTTARAFTGDPAAENTIAWWETSWPESPSAIGVTGPRWSGSRIVSAEMAMNGVHFTWTTGAGAGSTVNAYSIVLHEGGHYFGLGHTNVHGSTMFPSYSGGILSIGADDRAGICALYPGTGEPPPAEDCTTMGCPSGEECVAGMCRPTSTGGGGDICDPCSSRDDCGGGGLCLGYPSGNFCGRACSVDAECGSDICEEVAAGIRQCVRRTTSGEATCSGSAPPPPPPPPECTRDSDCAAAERCSGGSCVPRGTEPPPPECARNADCDASEQCVDGACVPRDTEPPPAGSIGAPCTGASSCESGLCAVDDIEGGTICTDACINDLGCPSAFECVPLSGAMGSVCLRRGAVSARTEALQGGCSVGGRAPGSSTGAAFTMLLGALIAFMRRRAAARSRATT